MENSKDLIRKAAALALVVAIAAGVFLIVPPATRLFVALLALPIETMILASLRGDQRRRLPHA